MYVYLLHFDKKISGCQHYMGSCEAKRLEGRLREHQTGNGANLTKRAVNQGSGFILAGLWQVPNRDAEKNMKKAQRHSKRCIECRRDGNNPIASTNVLYFPPLPSSHLSGVLSWPVVTNTVN